MPVLSMSQFQSRGGQTLSVISAAVRFVFCIDYGFFSENYIYQTVKGIVKLQSSS